MSVLHVEDGRPDLQSQKQVPIIPGGNDVGRSSHRITLDILKLRLVAV